MNLPLPLLKKKYPLQFGKNNPILRRVCDPITTFDHDTRELAYALTELLWEHDGV